MTFFRALQETLKWEGGRSNDPDDPGGETWVGITRRDHPYWSGWSLPRAAPDLRLQAHAAPVYYDHYWSPAGCSDLAELVDKKLAMVVFDTAVNMGVKTAVKMLQRAINSEITSFGLGHAPLAVDGITGPKTVKAARAMNNRFPLYSAVLQRRVQRYEAIVRNKPRMVKFIRGWLNRVEHFERLSA